MEISDIGIAKILFFSESFMKTQKSYVQYTPIFFLPIRYSASISFCCIYTFFTLSLRKYPVKHPWSTVESLLSTLTNLLETFREPLSACFWKERNSTRDVISWALKTPKAEAVVCRCNLLKRNSIKDHFLEIFCKFQSTCKRFGSEFVLNSLANCRL